MKLKFPVVSVRTLLKVMILVVDFKGILALSTYKTGNRHDDTSSNPE